MYSKVTPLYINMYAFFFSFSPVWLLRNIEQNSLCSRVGKPTLGFCAFQCARYMCEMDSSSEYTISSWSYLSEPGTKLSCKNWWQILIISLRVSRLSWLSLSSFWVCTIQTQYLRKFLKFWTPHNFLKRESGHLLCSTVSKNFHFQFYNP